MFEEKIETKYSEVYIIENGKKLTLFNKDNQYHLTSFKVLKEFENNSMAEILECNEALFKELVENKIDKERFSLSEIYEGWYSISGKYVHVIQISDKNGEVKALAHGVPENKNRPMPENFDDKLKKMVEKKTKQEIYDKYKKEIEVLFDTEEKLDQEFLFKLSDIISDAGLELQFINEIIQSRIKFKPNVDIYLTKVWEKDGVKNEEQFVEKLFFSVLNPDEKSPDYKYFSKHKKEYENNKNNYKKIVIEKLLDKLFN